MQPREDGFLAVGATDLDGIVFLAAILGAEDVDAARLRRGHGQASRYDGMQRRCAQKLGSGLGQRQQGQISFRGKCKRIDDRDHDGCRQKMGGFGQRDGGAVKIGRPVAQGPQRAFHRCTQVVGGVGDGAQPFDTLGGGDAKPGKVVVIGPRLERFRAPGSNRKFGLPKAAQRGKTLGRQRFDRDDQCRVAIARQHDGNAHAQIGPRAGKTFDDGGTQDHAPI